MHVRPVFRRAIPVLTILLLCAHAAPPAIADGDERGNDRGKDRRETFECWAYIGIGIDTFAAPDVIRYLNPDDSNKIQERGVGGVDFSFRALGSSDRASQLWLYGETVHGVRSADLDARDATTGNSFRGFDLSTRGSNTLYILRNASSLEAFVGARLEFAKLGDDDYRAHLYASAQYGGVTISGGTGDISDIGQVAGGLTLVNSPFQDSHLEIGYGRNDLFHGQPFKRWKIDGLVTWEQTVAGKTIHPFIQLCGDTDIKDGPDALQTYLGVDFDPIEIFAH